ncbi:GNAT family N-acetyltransferase [Streptomyces sp. WAC06614]|uniref:GNAT family N-acetyltransferase n=1 Tax=Streptomyces sp. WAC06614 TaxID=2487416 RepID=UPI001C8DA076|nr:GNAT family N-acetyltransferase [Streptomyces sp. WAC06614]
MSAQTTLLTRTELQRRPLTHDEAAIVVAEIRRSPKITGYSAAEWTGRRDTFALVDRASGELLGALLVHHLLGNWSEVAVVFIPEAHRGQGYGRQLLGGALRTLAPSGKRLLLFFSEPGPMEGLVREAGFDVFADEQDFAAGRPGRRLYLSVVYPVQWLWSFYRIRELRRKKRELDCSFSFKIALLETKRHGES